MIKNLDLFVLRQEIALAGYQRNLVDIYGKILACGHFQGGFTRGRLVGPENRSIEILSP